MKKFLIVLIFIITAAIAASCTQPLPEGEYFSVTFGGKYVNEYVITVEKNDIMSEPDEPRCIGKHFLYWATEDGKEYDFNAPVTCDVVLYAVWQQEEPEKTYYSVNFYGVDGELISTQRVAEGESANAPAVSTSDFFVFDGWDKDISSITCDTDVYASERYDSLDANLFTYKLNNDLTYSITGVKDDVVLPQMAGGYVKLALPTEYNGVEITAIASGEKKSGAFSRLNLLSVYIPSCYKKIGSYAFYGNPALSQVTFNEGLEVIGAGAFMATFGEGYVFYGRYAHSGASAYVSALTEINLPSSLEKIGAYAFNHVGGAFVNGNYVLNDVNLTFGENSKLKLIGDYAFEGVQIYNIDLPHTENLVIGDYAFAADSYLNWVYIGSYDYPRSITNRVMLPSSVSSIGDYAFYGLGVKSSYYNGNCAVSMSNVEFVADKLNLDYLGDGAFMGAKLNGSLNLAVENIGNNAFYGQNLSQINLNSVKTIGENAFAASKGNTTLTVNLGRSVVSIGKGAFQNNRGLLAISFPNTLKTIGQRAFYSCASLTGSIELPASLTVVGERAFALSGIETVYVSGNTQLKEECFAYSSLVSIRGNIKSIEEGTFSGCSLLVSASLPGDMTVVPKNLFNGCQSLTEIILPSSVITVGENAFADCVALSKITLSENLKTIKNNAFNNCSALSSVIFGGENVTLIEEGAFAFCPRLSAINLPDSVKVIGDCAFRGSGLTSFKTPASLESIGSRVFMQEEYVQSKVYGLMPVSIDSVPKVSLPVLRAITISKDTGPLSFSSLGTFDGSKITSFEVESGNEHYSSVDGVLYSADKTKLVMYIRDESVSSIELPEGLVEISEGTFLGNTFLYSVKFPSTLKVIGDYAFYNCTHLQSVTLPCSVESIGKYAFAGSLGSMSGLKNLAFDGKTKLSDIGEGAFAFNKGLKSVKLPSSLISLGEKAFYSAINLTLLDLSEAASLQVIGKEAFSGEKGASPQLKSVDFSGCVSLVGTGAYAFANCQSLESINFGDIEKIDEGSFYGCSKLTSLKLGDKVKEIGASAFRCCIDLSEITVGKQSELSIIEDYAFAGTITERVNYSSLDLTNAGKLTKIGEYAFAYGNVKSVALPNAPYVLGEDAFTSCTMLTSVSLGEGITTIGQNAFRYCAVLTEITIPSSVTTISKEAFSGLNLVSVNIGTPENGNSVTCMGKRAFFDCTSLTSVNIYGSNVPALSGKSDNLSFHYFSGMCFMSVIQNLTVYIDSGMTDSYVKSGVSVSGWEVYKDHIIERTA